MYRIDFTVGEYDDILEEHIDEFDEMMDQLDTEERGDTALVVRNFRWVIPDLNVCFREGDWYWKDENDPDSDWEYQDAVFVRYDENEKDINNYISFVTGSWRYSILDILTEIGKKDLYVDSIPCFIEFDDED